METLVQLAPYFTQIFTGPTAGLATVLLLIGGAGWLAWKGVFPILSKSWERQNKAMEAITAAMGSIRESMDAMRDAIEANTVEVNRRLDRVEAEIEKMGR